MGKGVFFSFSSHFECMKFLSRRKDGKMTNVVALGIKMLIGLFSFSFFSYRAGKCIVCSFVISHSFSDGAVICEKKTVFPRNEFIFLVREIEVRKSTLIS